MDFDASLLSRFPAAATRAAHSIFPSFTIGLASWLAVLEGLWLTVGNEHFRQLYRGWVRVFAAVFGVSVVAALTIPPASRLELVLEVVAFVLEAALLAAMLFGWRSGARLSHFAGTLVLAFGSVLFVLTWPGAMLPEHVFRLLLAAYLATAVMIAAVSAWRLMSDPTDDAACLALKMSIGMFVICAPLQLAAEIGANGERMRIGPLLAAVVLVVGLWGGALAWRGSPERSRLFLGACVLLAPVSPLSAAAAWVSPATGL